MLEAYIALIVSAVAAAMAILAPWYREATLLRAFKRLERDVDDMWEKVEAHLGRISRLKRTLAPKEPPPMQQLSLPGGVPGGGETGRPQVQTRRELWKKYRVGRVQ